MKFTKYFYIPVLLAAVSLLLFAVQKLIIGSISNIYTFYYPVWAIYVFHFMITFIVLTGLYFVGKLFPNFIGFTFMGFILLKMIVAVVFLIPLIKMENVSKIPDFASFFIPYFIYLFIEILLTMRLLKQYLK
ncbi:MAG: hypothetical protein ACTIJ9_16520 [Aequorivita sp.]